MEVICLQDEAFYALIDQVITRINGANAPKPDKWISGEENQGDRGLLSMETTNYYFLNKNIGKLPNEMKTPGGIK